ncbi:MAG: HAD family hydrolase [Nodosilinea sp.]
MGEFQPLSTASFWHSGTQPRLVATDMDGTLTYRGQFTPALLQGLERLRAAAMPVVMVTGRSAGWVHSLAHYLPMAGAMAENGGVYFSGPAAAPELVVDIPDIPTHRKKLGELFAQLQPRCPQIQVSGDNQFRLTDWTFDVQGLSPEDLETLASTCQTLGWGFIYSTVQCHLFQPGQSKAAGLQRVLGRYFPDISPAEVITVGDSPNDVSLFDPAAFPNSVGVANVKDYWGQLAYHPACVTNRPEVDGFLEIVEALLG